MDQTTTHTEPRAEGCPCKPWSLCAQCYARVEASWAQAEVAEWVGKLRPKPRLELVRR